MQELVKVVVDAMGGDNAPQETVKGAVDAVNTRKDIKVILTGRQELVEGELSKYTYPKDRIEVVNTTEVIETGGTAGECHSQKERFFNCGRNESCEKRRGRRFRIRWKYRSCSGRRTGDCRQDQRRGASAPCTADPHEGWGSTAD